MSRTRWRTVALAGCAALALFVPGTAGAATAAEHGDDPDGVTWIRPAATHGGHGHDHDHAAGHDHGTGHGHGAGHGHGDSGPGGVTWVRATKDRPAY